MAISANQGTLATYVDVEQLSKDLYRFSFMVDFDTFIVDVDNEVAQQVISNAIFKKSFYDYDYMDEFGNVRVVRSNCMEVKLFKRRVLGIRDRKEDKWLEVSM